MAISDTRLRICAFPQHWDGEELEVRVLVAPFGNPLQPLDPGLEPFARGQIKLRAHLIPHLDRLPRPVDATERLTLDAATPADVEDVYLALAAELNVDPAAPAAYVPPTKMRVMKMLMPSYLATSVDGHRRTEFAVTDNRYICALADGPRPVARPPRISAPPKWDAVLAMAIRQPLLARRLGLIYMARVRPPDAAFFENGGWLYVSLDESSDWFGASTVGDFLKCYAARIPSLLPAISATVFAPVLFPVAPTPPPGSFDEALREAELYADGFARLVHSFQPDRADYLNLARQDERRPRPYEESGLKLGWDDEQIVIWLNRQLSDDPRNNPAGARDTPLGVRGFRVDVRKSGAADWHSLVRMRGEIKVGALSLGMFDDEMSIELAPSQLQGQRDGEYWLSPYFAQWKGFSLIAPNITEFKVCNTPLSLRPLAPVGERAVPLRYGERYDFRVRMTDLVGGGPAPDTMASPSDSVVTTRFRRFVAPGSPYVAKPRENPDGSLTIDIHRPSLGYPAAIFTDLPNAEARLVAIAPQAAAQGRPAGLPDRDVTRLRIDVTVASLEYDPMNHPGPEPRRLLYTAFRGFDADFDEPLHLDVKFLDCADLTDFPLPPADGPIQLPTARTLELLLTSIARRDPAMALQTSDPVEAAILSPADLDADAPQLTYFGKHFARVGKSHSLTLRRESRDESGLFAGVPGVPFQCVLLRPGASHDAYLTNTNAASGTRDQAPESAIQRLARQLRLADQEQTLMATPGQRVVFGASAAIRHVLSPDHSTLTFADESAISGVWIAAVVLRMPRDWTWDGLTDEGLRVVRSINGGTPEVIGSVAPRRSLSASCVKRGASLARSHTDIVFFDAIDPKPAPGEFPAEIDVTYEVMPQFRTAPQPPVPAWQGANHLPIAAPPTQVPRIVSAGIALSPYERDERYTQTAPRRRQLWIEFAELVANPRDLYFGRVTMHAADPMLAREDPRAPPGPLEPPLNLDGELMRVIVADQPQDFSGLDAMEPLIAADGDGPQRHYLLPLPAALSEVSPELFGFFVYEFRVGHAKGWSTARARFGLPLRVAGIQHPAPTLYCSVSRSREQIRVSAPFAAAVADGQNLQTEPPCSALWALLYVQVRLADASDWRNILIGRTRLSFAEQHMRGRGGSVPHGTGYLDQDRIDAWLDTLRLPHNSALSVVAVETLPEPGSPFSDPLGKHLGQVRVLRTSPLTPVPTMCMDV